MFFYAALFSFFATIFGTLAALRWFPKLGFMDKPEKYGLMRMPIPYMGGLILLSVFLISTFLFVDLDRKVLGLLFGAVLIAFMSFLDDRYSLSPWIRLAIQAGVGILMVLSGVKIQILTNPFGDPFFLDHFKLFLFGEEIWILSAAFIVAWLILMMNVMNWLDGIPGLTSGVGIIASLVMFSLSIQGFHVVDQSVITVMSLSLASSLLAFWAFDISPPKILMGDTGSMLLGFLLGMFAIFSGGKIATALLIMGFPVLDSIWVIMRRLLSGQSPMKGDLSHFHHRLLRAGLSERKALILNYSICALFGAIAIFLHSSQQKFIALLLLSAMMVVTAIFVILFEKSSKYTK